MRRSLGKQAAGGRRSSPHGWPLRVVVSRCSRAQWTGQGGGLRAGLTSGLGASEANSLLDLVGDGHGGRAGGAGAIAGREGGEVAGADG